MFTDIVFPKNNEKELADMAQHIGTKKLLLLYEFGKQPATIPKFPVKVDLYIGVVCKPVQVQKALQQGFLVAVRSSDKDRLLFERKNAPHLLLGLCELEKSDRIHQRESGVNQPLLRDLHRHKASVVLSVASLLERSGAERAQLFGRWMQNIALCRKMKVSIRIASCASNEYGLRAPQDRQSIGVVLGMHEKDAKDAVTD